MHKLTFISIFFLLTGCVKSPTTTLSESTNFKQFFVQTTPFRLATYQKILQPGIDVNIYIEGDGHAWLSRSQLSSDPSPHSPTVMQLASIDLNPNVVYLARPCQYSPEDLKTICDDKYWSIARYAPEVVASINDAVTQIKQKANCKNVNLIGYSGGGALAVLVAARRNDVATIRTIAANLDLDAMDKIHNTTPLSESMNPLEVAKQIRRIPQLHFVGAKDKVVPKTIAFNFVHAAQLDDKKVIVVRDASHNKNWNKHWQELLKYVP